MSRVAGRRHPGGQSPGGGGASSEKGCFGGGGQCFDLRESEVLGQQLDGPTWSWTRGAS